MVVVRKTTRLEYERKRNQLSEEELRNRVWEWDMGMGYGNEITMHLYHSCPSLVPIMRI